MTMRINLCPLSAPSLRPLPSGWATSLLLLSVALLGLPGCESVPGHRLSTTERLADAHWLVAQIERNYAPLELKEQQRGFRWEELKAEFLRDAAEMHDSSNTTTAGVGEHAPHSQSHTNEDFYLRAHRLVARLGDAHTSLLPPPGVLPGRAKIATLGFSGSRVGRALWVESLISLARPGAASRGSLDPSRITIPAPGSSGESASEAASLADAARTLVAVGDRITHLDGIPLVEAVAEVLVPYRDLGNNNANLTFHMNRLFNRISLYQPMPERASARIRGLRPSGEAFEVELPWIQKDLQEVIGLLETSGLQLTDFQNRPIQPQLIGPQSGLRLSPLRVGPSAQTPGSSSNSDSRTRSPSTGGGAVNPRSSADWRNLFGAADPWTQIAGLQTLGAPSYNTGSDFPVGSFSGLGPSLSPTPGFPAPSMEGRQEPRRLDAWRRLTQERNVPSSAVPIQDVNAFAAYISREGQGARRRQVATIRIPSFNPEDLSLGQAFSFSRETVLRDFKLILAHLQELGIEILVIDLLNNQGGSVTLGLEMAQALSTTRLPPISIRLVLNETWQDTFEQDALEAQTETERELSRRVATQLRDQRASGARLSQPFGTDLLLPFQLNPNSELERGFKVALLVNELCGSTCDLFAAQLKGLPWVKVVGAQTLGAGGNVSDRPAAPVSRMGLHLTESLLFGPSGEALENHGVLPDIEVDVSEDLPNRYSSVRSRAVQALLED